MNSLEERIAQFSKMSQDDPDNELGHYRLGQLLQEANRHEDAIRSFRRTLELSPQFSKVFLLLGKSQVALGRKDEAIATFQEGHKVATERGDRIPASEIAKELEGLGVKPPEPAAAPEPEGPETGFKCARLMCPAGKRARQLDKSPMPDELGQEIQEKVCADCWNAWFKDMSVKVINELRLDLSSEASMAEYDKHMREFLGLSG
ncbi:MAG: Fe(2+)-trafficking protein [Gemmataceae bacterium]